MCKVIPVQIIWKLLPNGPMGRVGWGTCTVHANWTRKRRLKVSGKYDETYSPLVPTYLAIRKYEPSGQKPNKHPPIANCKQNRRTKWRKMVRTSMEGFELIRNISLYYLTKACITVSVAYTHISLCSWFGGFSNLYLLILLAAYSTTSIS